MATGDDATPAWGCRETGTTQPPPGIMLRFFFLFQSEVPPFPCCSNVSLSLSFFLVFKGRSGEFLRVVCVPPSLAHKAAVSACSSLRMAGSCLLAVAFYHVCLLIGILLSLFAGFWNILIPLARNGCFCLLIPLPLNICLCLSVCKLVCYHRRLFDYVLIS